VSRARRNPALEGATLVYPEVEAVYARKGAASGEFAGPYVHRFTSKPAMFGLPNGDLLLTARRENPPRRRRRNAPRLPAGFVTALKKRIRGGMAAPKAMQATWRQFKRKRR
jgi:hypothetical protein